MTQQRTSGGRWPMRLSDAVTVFIQDVANAKPSPSTAKTYQAHLRRLPAFVRRDAVTEMGEPLVRSYFAQLKAAQLKPNSVAGASTALSQFCKWGVRRGYWPRDPTDDPLFRVRRPDPAPKPHDADEMGRLMALELRDIERVARDTLYYTGIRVTPLITIRLCDVSFARVRIGDLVAEGTIRTVNKGNKVLTVYIGPELKPILEAWIATRKAEGAQAYDPLFRREPRYGPGAVTRTTVERWATAWGEAAQVLGCTPHRFRHTYATDLLRDGVKIEFIQKLLGHASISTTQVYLKVADAGVLGAALQRRRPKADGTHDSYTAGSE